LKFQLYRTLPSLREYITVAQDQVHLEHYVRQPEGSWLLTEFESPDKVISLQSIKTDLRLADVYERVDFSNQETEPRP
jgi:Uma2 family endonuclease